MTTIEKLRIQGIRSFSPNAWQTIEFEKPLTIIVGHNGAGKTTIIESLLYACCGEKPPGTGTGGAFVHDPKHAGQREVKAQVRLLFRIPSGSKCVVTRNLQAEQKEDVRMKTLDSTIEITMPDGSKTSNSAKCADIDKQVPLLMGVSKPILELVIFCHQEDSNWPLMGTDAELKKRFDLIFSADRYRKALVEIKDRQKELKEMAGRMEPELGTIMERQQHIKEYDSSLQSKKEAIANADNSINALQQEKTRLQQRVTENAELSAKIRSHQNEVGKLEAVRKEVAARCAAYRAEMDPVLEGTEQTLRQKQNEFEVTLQQQRQGLAESQQALQQAEGDMKGFEQKQKQVQEEWSTLSGRLGAMQDENSRREKALAALAAKFKFEAGNVAAAKEALVRMEEQLASARKEFDQQRAVLESGAHDAGARLSLAQAERSQLSKQEAQTTQELNQAEQELVAKRRLGAQRADTEERLEKAKKELDRAKASLGDTGTMEEEIEKLHRDQADKEKQVQAQSTLLAETGRHAAALEKVRMLEQNVAAKESELKSAELAMSETVLRVLRCKTMPAYGLLPGMLDKVVAQGKESLEKLNKLVDQANSNRASLESRVRQLRSEREALQKKESELTLRLSKRPKLKEGSVKDQLDELEREYQASSSNVVELQAQQTMYKKFAQHAKSSSSCFVCKRPFDDEERAGSFLSSLEQQIENARGALAPAREEEQESLQSVHEIKKFLPLEEELHRVSSKLEDVIAELAVDEPELATLAAEVKLLREQVQDEVKDAEAIAPLQTRVAMLLRLQSEYENAKSQRAALKLDGAQAGQSIEEVQRRLTLLQRESAGLQKEIAAKRRHLDSTRKDLGEKEKVVAELMEKLMQASTSEESTMVLSETVAKLKSSLQKLQEQKKMAQQEIAESTAQKDHCAKKLAEFVQKRSASVESIEKECASLRSGLSSGAESLQSEMESLKVQLVELSSQKAALATRGKTLASQVADKRALVDQLSKAVNEAAMIRKNLDTNIKFRAAEKSLNEYDSQMREKKAELQDLGVTPDSLALMEKDQKDFSAASGKLERLHGHRDTLLAEKKDLEKRIKNCDPEKVRKDMQDKMVALETTRLAIKDLEEYHTALDQALMKYHEEKMAEINGIIRELWQTTYRGNDIDTIAIRAEVEKKGKKTHKYRVVMVKGDCALDMRGRCSAGQKVLASLIIRLALAESFGLHCGILALDEPTTNLDRDNIESLAQGLGTILRNRRNQAGFQLIVITHDEEFVQMLGRSDFADHYFQVTKDENSFSTIAKKDIVELG